MLVRKVIAKTVSLDTFWILTASASNYSTMCVLGKQVALFIFLVE